MPDKLKMIVMASALIAALLFALSCGGGDDNDTGDTPTPEPTEEATATPNTSGGPSPSPTQLPAESDAGISLKEYVITMERTRARPGTVTFQVRNEGQLTHQMVFVRTDIEKDELPRKPNDEGVDESDLDVVGRIDSIAPGDSADVAVDVQEGEYVLFCNLFAGGVSHYLEGMYQEFEVTPTAPLGTPAPTVAPVFTPLASP